MSIEIGRLTAVFDADTRKFDSSLKASEERIKSLRANIASIKTDDIGFKSQRIAGLKSLLDKALSDHKALQAAQKATAQSAKAMSNDMKAALDVISPRLGRLTELAGPLTAVAVGLAAIAGVAVGLFELAKSAAKTGGDLFDLSQKTAFTVETLSGLSIVAKTTGSDINGLSPSLVIFQKNMEAASDATSKQGRLFRSLSIDTHDNEKALRQAFAALGRMREGSQQTALAMQLFGRSGKDVLAIIKETNGNLDAAIKRYGDMGLIISTGAAAASDKFNDLLEETTLQLEAVTRSIGMELLPVVTDALQSISAGLRANKDEWASWGTSIANVMRGLSVAVHSELGQMLGRISEFSIKWLSLTGLIVQGLGALGAGADKPSEDFFGPGGAGRGGRKTLPGTPEFKAAQRRLGSDLPSLAGGGGKKGGGGGEDPAKTAQRIASLQLEAVINGLKAEQEANRRALDLRRRDFNDYANRYMVIENRRHDAVIAGLDKEKEAAEKLKKGREVALQEIANKRTEENTTHEQNRNKVLDERGKILDRINDFLRDQEREISGLTTSTDQWDQAYQQLVDTLKEEGVTLEENTKSRLESNIAILKEIDLVKQQIRVRQVLKDSTRDRFETRAGRERPPWIDIGGGSTVGGEPATTTRPRIATADEQVMRDQLERIRGRMRDLGFELTDIFAQSVGDGFSRGIKSGLESLSLGLLRIVEDVFLRRMAKGLGDLLGDIGTGSGGGGGFFGGLLKSILGSVAGTRGGGSAGGLGTGIAGAIGRDSGGPLWPKQLYKVHKDEYIVPTSPGFVIPKGGMGQQTVVNKYYTIQLPPDSRGSYNSPRSKRQLSETLIAALEASKA